MHFSNGGLNVNLLRYNMAQKSAVKRTISAYTAIGTGQASQKKHVHIEAKN